VVRSERQAPVLRPVPFTAHRWDLWAHLWSVPWAGSQEPLAAKPSPTSSSRNEWKASQMTDASQSTDGLSPRPDSETGEPFPPHGVSYFRGEPRDPVDDPNRESRLSHKPNPPPGHGPVLAWHRESRRGKIATVVASGAILIVGAAVISLLNDMGLGAFGYWQSWAIIVVGTVLMSSPFSDITYSAGADWLQMQITRFGVTKRVWIGLYDLTKVDASYGGITFHLWLWSKRGGLSLSFEELQRDRRIWDLVYNGILHSVANGATVTQQATGILKLNETSALRLRDSATSQDT
jgi:hypothetical protein